MQIGLSMGLPESIVFGLFNKISSPDDTEHAFNGASNIHSLISRSLLMGHVSGQYTTLYSTTWGAVLFDGWLDNRRELQGILGLSSRHTDGDLVVAALERWQDGACHYLRGNYTVGYWQKSLSRITLFNDHTGNRVFYHCEMGGRFLFSNNIALLWQTIPQLRRANNHALIRRILDIPLAVNQTFFQGIQCLPPAGMVVVTPEEYTLSRYWMPKKKHGEKILRDAEYVEQARSLLDRSVASQLPLQGPIVAMTSGGLDSSAVTATAANLRPDRQVYSLTAVPGKPVPENNPKALYDEGDHAQAIATMYPNLRHIRCPPGAPLVEFLTSAPFFAHTSHPIRNPLNFSWLSTVGRKASSLGAHCLLSGVSGNCTLSYKLPNPLYHYLKTLSIKQFHEDFSRQINKGASVLRLLFSNIVMPTTYKISKKFQLARNKRKRYHPYSTCLNFNTFDSIDVDAIAYEKDFSWLYCDHPDHWQRHLIERTWRSYAATRPYRLLNNIYQSDPLGSVEWVEFCLNLPWQQYYRHGVTRYLARRVLADRLPPLITEETRIGMQSADWADHIAPCWPAMRQALDELHNSALVNHYLDLPRMNAIADQWNSLLEKQDRQVLVDNFIRSLHYGLFMAWMDKGCPSPGPLPDSLQQAKGLLQQMLNQPASHPGNLT